MGSKPSPPPPILNRLIETHKSVSLHLHSTFRPILPRSLLKTLEISGDGRLFFPVAISFLLSPLSTAAVTPLLSSLLAGAVLDLLLVGLTKHLFRRPRPVYNQNMFLSFAVDHWSFPSGHSSRVCFVAAFLSLSSAALRDALAQLRLSRVEYVDKLFKLVDLDDGVVVNLVVLVACSWAAATTVSRVLLGRHFVCDVIAGALLGVLEALIVFRFFNYSILESYFSRLMSLYP